MTKTDAIVINGQYYDPVTGLPIQEHSSSDLHTPAAAPVHRQKPATHLHTAPQRSTTLHRKSTKKPTPLRTTIHHHVQPKRIDGVSKHPQVRKFAPQSTSTPTRVMDIGAPAVHPHVAKAHAKSAAKAQPLTQHLQSAHDIKEQAVRTAVAQTHKKQPLRQRLQPRQRTVAVLSAVFALVLLGSYLTYLNMPSLSVRVAAAQAGINASYPNYHPDGYSLAGPVSYTDGRVSMNFKANGGNQEFVVNQSKSGWNSEAVLDNYVTPRAGSSYIPYTERGLTIYTYDNNAAWVNGGILYTIEGDAPLSSEQIRRIATSLL